MTKLQRFESILSGLAIILASLLIFWLPDPEYGILVVVLILIFSLLFSGLRCLVYYLTMARHMVGGKAMLYVGILRLDLVAFTLTLTDVPRIYVVLYVLSYHAFSGVVGILRGLEAKKLEAPSWRLKTLTGVVNILIAAACGIFIHSGKLVIWLYCAGLLYSGCVRIVSAFRRSAIVYIP